jgi:hypothetical protein
MNCKRCEEHLATGNFIQRGLAQRHARRCPACRRSLELADRLRQEMSATVPLTDQQRQLWSRAMDVEVDVAPVTLRGQGIAAEPIAMLRRPIVAIRRRPAWAAGLAAAVMAIFALGWVAGRMSAPNGAGNNVARQQNDPEKPGGRNEDGPSNSEVERQRGSDREGEGAFAVEVQPPGTFPSALDPPASVEEVRAGLLALSQRLDRLASQAVLLDERQEVTRLAELSRPTR